MTNDDEPEVEGFIIQPLSREEVGMTLLLKYYLFILFSKDFFFNYCLFLPFLQQESLISRNRSLKRGASVKRRD